MLSLLTADFKLHSYIVNLVVKKTQVHPVEPKNVHPVQPTKRIFYLFFFLGAQISLLSILTAWYTVYQVGFTAYFKLVVEQYI